MENSNILSFIDAIYCINLSSRTDRWEKVCKEFEKIGLQDVVIRFNAIYIDGNGASGCMLSHRKIIEEAKKKWFKKILIFEDDIQVLDPKKFLKQLTIIEGEEFDMCYLSGIFLAPNAYLLQYKDVFFQIHKWVFGAQAIIISENIFDIILDILPVSGDLNGRRIHDFDEIYANVIQRYFVCIIPRNIYIEQRGGYSNISLCTKWKLYLWWNRLGFFLASKKNLYYMKYFIFSARFYFIELFRKYLHIKIKW